MCGAQVYSARQTMMQPQLMLIKTGYANIKWWYILKRYEPVSPEINEITASDIVWIIVSIHVLHMLTSPYLDAVRITCNCYTSKSRATILPPAKRHWADWYWSEIVCRVVIAFRWRTDTGPRLYAEWDAVYEFLYFQAWSSKPRK